MKQHQQKTKNRGALAAAASLSALGVVAGAAALLTPPPVPAHAQVPFRIARPENGATVRETVRFQIPRRSLPDDAKYLSLTIDDKFRGGIFIPPANPDPAKAVRTEQIQANASTVYLLWDTKAPAPQEPGQNLPESERLVQDGPHTVLLSVHDANGKRIASQTVTVNVNNRGTLPSPAGGVPLTYNFRVGQERYYRQRTEVNYINDRANTPVPGGGPFAGGGGGGNSAYGSRGGRGGAGGGGVPGGFQGGGEDGGYGGPPPGYGGPPGGGFGGRPGGGGPGGPGGQTSQVDIPVQVVTANYERTVEDNLGGGQFFLRDKVGDGVIVGGNGSAARLEEVYDFKSRYRTVLNSGFVKDYGTASLTRPGAYIALPLINLGGVRRSVKQRWTSKSPVLLEWATLDKPPMVTVQNELETLEWQDNRQTARIKQTYNGKADIPIYGGAGVMKNADVKMERTIWFGFKTGDIIRMETNMEVAGDGPATVLQAMVPQAGFAGGAGGLGGFPGLGGGGDEGGGFGGFPGAPGGGFPGAPGGMGGLGGRGGLGGGQQQQQVTLAPAKFRSKTVVTLASGPSKQTAAR